MKALEARLCDPATCTNVRDRENGHRGHREILGGNHMRYSTRMKYRIPEGVIRYLCGFPDPDLVAAIRDDLSRMRLSLFDTVRFEHEIDERFLDDMASLMARMEGGQVGHNFVSSVVLAAGGLEGEEVEKKRATIFRDYANTVFTTVMPKVRPVRGPFGEANIVLKPGAQPVKQRPFHLLGERREALERLIEGLEKEGKLEDGVSAWSSPAFPVPKKRPGEYRLVVDYRAVNDATITDAHPLPRIEDILQKQGKYKVCLFWT